MTVFQKAYFCAELRTGVGLIGWWGTILASIILFCFCNYLLGTFVIDATFSPNLYHIKGTPTKWWEVVIVLLTWTYYFCASFLLIVAALKKKEVLLLPWLVVAIIDIVILACKISYMGFTKTPFSVFITYLLILFIMLYTWLIVYSYFLERQKVKTSINQRSN